MRKLRCILVFASLSVISALAGTNLIPDGGFESLSVMQGTPQGWCPLEQGMDMDSAHNYFTLCAEPRGGTAAAVIMLDTLSSGFAARMVTGLKPQTWYCLTAWMKGRLSECSGRGPTILAGRHPASNPLFRLGGYRDQVYGQYAAGQAGADWAPMKLAFKTGDDVKGVWIALGVYNAKGRVVFDDLALEEISAAEAETVNRQFKSSAPDRLPEKPLLPGHAAKSRALDEAAIKAQHLNLVRNGSFEAVGSPPVADCWVHGLHYAAFDKDIAVNYRVVEENPYHGRRCFRLKGSSLHFASKGLLDQCRSSGVLSMYLRADEPEAELTVTSNGRTETFKPGKEWKLFEMKLPKVTKNGVSRSLNSWMQLMPTFQLQSVRLTGPS